MKYMLVRNRVRDFAAWKRVFDAQGEAAREAGLRLVHLWQETGEPNAVWFVLEMEDAARAEAYVTSPASQAVGERAGVVDGELWYLEGVGN